VREGLALDITRTGQCRGGFKQYLSEGWLSSFEYDGKNYGIPTDAVSKYFYYDKAFFAEHKLAIPTTFGGLLGLCKSIRAIDPQLVPWPAGQFGALEAQSRHHHAERACARRRCNCCGLRADRARRPALHEPGYVEAWQKVVDLKEAGCFQDAPNATSPEAAARCSPRR